MSENRIIVKSFLSALIFISLIFSSCNNLFDNDNNSSSEVRYVTVSGAINPGAALPANIASSFTQDTSESGSLARTAFPTSPSISSTSYSYIITAVNTENEEESYTGSSSYDDTNSVRSYSIRIPVTEAGAGSSNGSKYKIIIEVKDGEITILKGESEEFTISLSSPVVTTNVELSAISQGNGLLYFGMLSLAVTVDSDSGIDSAKFFYLDSNGNETSANATVSETTYTFETGSISGSTFTNCLNAGPNSIRYEFYSDSGQLLYSFTDIANIFNGLTTNTWVKNGSNPWFTTVTDASGKKTTTCRITKAMVDSLKLTEFYVDSSRTTEDSSASNYTTGSGTFINPFENIETAIEVIKQINNGTSDYTINLCSDQDLSKLTSSLLITPTDKALKLTIQSNPDTDIKYALDGKGESFNSPLIKISGKSVESTKVILKNIIIRRHTNSAESGSYSGGGLYTINAEVVLEDCEISGNSAKYGGGLYTDSSSKISLTNCLVEQNTSSSYGGGICAYSTNTSIIKCKINNNTSSSYGGGLYCKITEAAEITLKECNINDNTSKSGGGVYCNCYKDLEIFSSTLSNNSAEEEGGAISFYGANYQLILSGTTIITGNTVSSEGNNGGAIYHTYSSNSQTKGVVFKDSSYVPYGGEVNNNDIFTAKIYIASRLTPPEDIEKIAAINLAVYDKSQVLLLADNSDPSASISTEYSKFIFLNRWLLDEFGFVKREQSEDDKRREITGASDIDNLVFENGGTYEISYTPSSSTSVSSQETVVKNILEKIKLPRDSENNIVLPAELKIDFSATSIESFPTYTYESDMTHLKYVTSLKLPNTIVQEKNTSSKNYGIHSGYFENATKLEEVIMEEGNQYYKTIDGVLYSYGNGTDSIVALKFYPPAKKDSSFTLPDFVTQLYTPAFRNNNYLEEINGLSRVNKITGMDIFRGMEKIKVIDFRGASFTSLGSGYTFVNNNSVEKIYMPAGLTDLKSTAFENGTNGTGMKGCPNLVEIHFYGPLPTTIYNSSFTNYNENLKIYVPEAYIDDYKNKLTNAADKIFAEP